MMDLAYNRIDRTCTALRGVSRTTISIADAREIFEDGMADNWNVDFARLIACDFDPDRVDRAREPAVTDHPADS